MKPAPSTPRSPRAVRAFLARPSVEVAPGLVGWRLVRTIRSGRRTVELAGRIVEAEAYAGPDDKAAHSFGGKQTPRTASMYRRAGTAYVYFTYGMHHCLNVVVAGEGEPQAVLIRALEPEGGSVDGMRANRAGASGRAHQGLRPTDLCSGPAKLCQSMGVDRALDGGDLLAGPGVLGLRLEPPGAGVAPPQLASGARIGLSERAGEWRELPWRWWEAGNRHVSRR